jgi:hypothetical protein
MKEDFSNPKDPQTATYKAALATNNRVKQIHDIYMQLVSCEMLFLKSKLEDKEEHTQQANLYKLEGLKALGALKKEKYLTHYLGLKLEELSRTFE